MGETVRLRSTTSRVVGAAAMVFAAVGLGLLVATGNWDQVQEYGALLALIGVGAWIALWSAYVEVSDGGVTMRNVLRTVRVPWPAITEVEGRYGLRLRTAYGTFDAWAAAAPSGRARLGAGQSESSDLVRHRLEELRRAGHLDNPRLERDRAGIQWNVPEIAAIALCVAGTVVSALA